MLQQVGVTPEGKAITIGVFKFYETEGLPLVFLFDYLIEVDAIPCWITFYREALAAKMKHSRILAMLGEAVFDAYGALHRDHVVKVLEALHTMKHPSLDLEVPWRYDECKYSSPA